MITRREGKTGREEGEREQEISVRFPCSILFLSQSFFNVGLIFVPSFFASSLTLRTRLDRYSLVLQYRYCPPHAPHDAACPHTYPQGAVAQSSATTTAAAVARALGAGPVINAVGLGPEAEEKDSDNSGTGPQKVPAPADGGRFGVSGKWVPTLSGAR